LKGEPKKAGDRNSQFYKTTSVFQNNGINHLKKKGAESNGHIFTPGRGAEISPKSSHRGIFTTEA